MRGRRRRSGLWPFIREEDAAWDRERLLIVLFDPKRKVIGVKELPPKGLSLVQLRNVFSRSLPRASAFLCIHNRPRVNPGPSGTVRSITYRLKKLADAAGIQLLDHLIFSRGRYRSALAKQR